VEIRDSHAKIRKGVFDLTTTDNEQAIAEPRSHGNSREKLIL